ncbi:endonuclease MutS2 [Anaerosacchariphilus polymeriproducens]|uniref:DNA mismatch repair protein MutS n=1 Tax=Anaerosacchariphilus polymeriproducens TaxID=1812858 RepID=A0A371AR03_9FIRM|nr:DNA mismatch repair protein MutS [Anaerosacchariphilus polymeriproducens]RDU22016.1 DNA mismatch repair protein MutS [Anaerosacchariphilus polymeriproducens]
MNYIKDMLEFDKIIDKLREYTVTEKAKERFKKLAPYLNEGELLSKLKETTEARKLLDTQGTPPLAAVDKIREIGEAAEKGELLSIEELEKVKQFATLSMRMIQYLKRCQEVENQLGGFGNGMVDLELLKEEIERCIRNGRVDDYASKELKEIRKKIERSENDIRLKLESILKGKKGYFSESFVSNRNGHYTLPVKKEHKLQVSGSVIDISSSGATYFIEPVSVAKLRDKLEELKIEENNEERRVLYIISSLVSDFKADILLNLDYIEELDYIFAKGKLSVEMDGKEARINTDRRINLVNGRHPLIDKKECVPLNISFGKEIKGVVITGPNTGGKTVALKTLGLCSVMAQSGLHIPCEEADICMNTNVLCDIGDGQSITENLSTFSAHMKNVIHIIEVADKDSFVLLDELGSGTDPAEGMGIAVSILEELNSIGCNFIATTHYPEVKDYASKTEGIINARMAFDKESLKPLYRLELGEAGESCAFYIAKRLGMSASMLERAYKEAYQTRVLASENKVSKYLFQEEEKIKKERTAGNQITKKVDKPDSAKEKIDKFHIGDSVMVYPQKKLGIVFEPVNSKGEVGVQIQKKKMLVNHKRLKIKAFAKDLYPEDYDFSIIFDTVENRKARHQMERKYTEGLEITYEPKLK